jgi:hypothetical protein
VVGHTQIHDEQREPDEYKNRTDSRQDYQVHGYASNGSIVGLQRLYRTSLRQLLARSPLAVFAAS